MEIIEKEDFKHFGELCRFCREHSDPPLSRSALSKQLKYASTGIDTYIVDVERARNLGSPAFVKGVVDLFGLDKEYVLALLAKQALGKYSRVLQIPQKPISVGKYTI